MAKSTKKPILRKWRDHLCFLANPLINIIYRFRPPRYILRVQLQIKTSRSYLQRIMQATKDAEKSEEFHFLLCNCWFVSHRYILLTNITTQILARQRAPKEHRWMKIDKYKFGSYTELTTPHKGVIRVETMEFQNILDGIVTHYIQHDSFVLDL